MLAQIKKLLPKPIKRVLALIYHRIFGQWQKRRLYLRMQRKHQILLTQIKEKERIRVIFLAIHKGVWKVDLVFQKMLSDPFFDPLILVCPYTAYGEDRMQQEMKICFENFKEKGYPVRYSFCENSKEWLDLNKFNPDIIFFTNPHELTNNKYYKEAFSNYLTCYVPYFTDVASSYDLNNVYNQFFHNSLWFNFSPDEFSKKRAASVLANKGKNIKLTGSLICEAFLSNNDDTISAWKEQSLTKKKIIYAAHQSINECEAVNFSTFLAVGEIIKYLAIKHQDSIQWAFRPHPILKPKLYEHPDWGVEKTDSYYDFWENESYTQLSDGEYIDLFKTSDALIHDCGSFIIEYLYAKKPCAYILLDQYKQLKAINDQGHEALQYYHILHTIKDIEEFVNEIVRSDVALISGHEKFVEKSFGGSRHGSTPSGLIIESIKNEIFN